MVLVSKIITALIFFAMVFIGVLFAIQNTALVPLDLLFVILPERSVALWMISALAIGAALGMVVSWGIVLKLRKDRFLARRQLISCRKELNSLRGVAGKK
jgi:putative membrane protein